MNGPAAGGPHVPPAPLSRTNGSRYFEAPDYYQPRADDPPGVFLAGTISGVARWHDHAVDVLRSADQPLVLLNPHRRHFPIDDPAAGWAQVSWEQHHLHLPNVLTMFWFPASDPAVTTAPIALFELGQALGERRPVVVGAHPDYPRVADVRLLCTCVRPELLLLCSLDDVLTAVLSAVSAGWSRGAR